MLKNIFGKSDDSREEGYSIDDLIVLERYDEAAERLKTRLSRRDATHDHLRLANCYVGMREIQKAIDEYVYVAEDYAADGFFERGIAILSKARRLDPGNETIAAGIEALEAKRRLEQSRAHVVDGFAEGQREKEGDGRETGTEIIELQGLWESLAASRLVEELEGDELRAFFRGVELVRYKAGDLLAARGERDERMYVVASGEVAARARDVDGHLQDVRTFGNGQIIGERALLGHEPWPARYVVTRRATLLCIDAEGLTRCLKGHPDPKGFLETLRRDRADEEVARLVAQLDAKKPQGERA